MKAGGKEYRLHLGMSVLADLQEKFGDKFDELLAPPKDGKMPNLRVIQDVFIAALQRYHEDEADRWLVDDLIAENADAFGELLTSSFPDVKEGGKDGPGAKKRKAAA
ncbi:hypothetical protein PZ897_02055 [Hoeflea sp. YIM 152468]|uniref:hypothetical protein n=1 Tax=Hoeflea sp. YIM 152468 TaxID=3031759 RepID=UPI0023DBE6FF|nr:hypothetical protein [Hoeflea sp. YIM 152468]MDF1606954.1 hypothetical protein [Hoeflea sp. YIM 152468]